MNYSINVDIEDPYASHEEVLREYGLDLLTRESNDYDAIIVAVGHNEYRSLLISDLKRQMKEPGILFDLKGLYEESGELIYWRL